MRSFFTALLVSLLSVGLNGCGEKAAEQGESKPAGKEASHDHPSKGPHGGDLIELGDEEYHGEFVHDEKTCDVTIYILDSAAKNPVAVEATEVVINLKHDGKPEQHKLAAAPTEGEAAGKTSRFAEKEKHDLCHAMEEEGADARLQVTIGGKSYTGKIEHDHEHSHGDDHDHGHDHDHEKK